MWRACSARPPPLLNAAQCGQVIEPYSISFTGAAGLPMRTPPSGVRTATWLQSRWAAGARARCAAGARARWAAESDAGATRAARVAIATTSARMPISAADRGAQPRFDARPVRLVDFVAVEDEGRRLVDLLLGGRPLRHRAELLQRLIVGEAGGDPRLRHPALAEELVEAHQPDQLGALLLWRKILELLELVLGHVLEPAKPFLLGGEKLVRQPEE